MNFDKIGAAVVNFYAYALYILGIKVGGVVASIVYQVKAVFSKLATFLNTIFSSIFMPKKRAQAVVDSFLGEMMKDAPRWHITENLEWNEIEEGSHDKDLFDIAIKEKLAGKEDISFKNM